MDLLIASHRGERRRYNSDRTAVSSLAFEALFRGCYLNTQFLILNFRLQWSG